MSALADKIRKARETRVPCGQHTFIVRRPTSLQITEWSRTRDVLALLEYVVGWDGVTEADLVVGGDPHPLPFDRDAFIEWVSDKPALFSTITSAIISAVEAHTATLQAAEKN